MPTTQRSAPKMCAKQALAAAAVAVAAWGAPAQAQTIPACTSYGSVVTTPANLSAWAF